MIGRLVWAALLASVAAPTSASVPSIGDFTCNKRAFYTEKGGGTREVYVPTSLCATVVPAAGVLEKLCCANTHVVCSDKYKEPTLVNYYDGADKIKGSDFLQQALDNLCKMSMAKTCSDCDQSKCTLFNASPAKRSCYGYFYTDSRDGSGFPAATTTPKPTPTPPPVAQTIAAAASVAGARSARNFVCNKRSFYNALTQGTRKVYLPNAVCDTMAPAEGMLEALCCANTHVVCSDQYSTPTLVSYRTTVAKDDSGTYTLGQVDYLQQALDTTCKMSMAKSCSDCDRSRCALFNASPAPRSCYGSSRTDTDDGSGYPVVCGAGQYKAKATASACEAKKTAGDCGAGETFVGGDDGERTRDDTSCARPPCACGARTGGSRGNRALRSGAQPPQQQVASAAGLP